MGSGHVVLMHAGRGRQDPAEVAHNNAHDACHHEWDIRRTLDQVGPADQRWRSGAAIRRCGKVFVAVRDDFTGVGVEFFQAAEGGRAARHMGWCPS